VNNSRATLTFPKLSIACAVFAFTCGFLLWGLFRSPLDHLLSNWGDGDYSYAWLIPFVILFLVWEKRDRLSAEPVVIPWWGIAPLSIGIAFFGLGELGGEYYTLYLSAWSMVVGILWLFLGWRKIKVLAFPVFLVLTTFPLPAFLYFRISFQLQLISSMIGTALLQTMGIVAHREGNVIDIGLTQLQVVEACSGLRYVFPLLVLGLIVAYFFRASIWKRVCLVLSTIPLTIFWNSMRIALTGVLWIKWGPTAAEGFLHDFSGFVIFLISLVVLFGEMWILSKIGKPWTRSNPSLPVGKDPDNLLTPTISLSRKEDAPGPSAPEDSDLRQQTEENEVFPKFHRPPIIHSSFFSYLPRAITILVLLGTTLFFFGSTDFRQRIPIREPLNKFPIDIADWRGTHGHLDPGELKTLKFSDYIVIDFRNKAGQAINFYVAYFESQVKGGSIHSPETCLPGHGWDLKESVSLAIPVKYGRGYLNVNRTVAEQLDSKNLAYFWFQQRGRDLTNIYQIKLYNFWDALTQHRTDGALVRVITPMYKTESVDEAGARLNEFLSKVMPILDRFIPGPETKQ